jgi:hypothetical protein
LSASPSAIRVTASTSITVDGLAHVTCGSRLRAPASNPFVCSTSAHGASAAPAPRGQGRAATDARRGPAHRHERAAVEGDHKTVDRLIDQLADVATPAGPTPSELAEGDRALS